MGILIGMFNIIFSSREVLMSMDDFKDIDKVSSMAGFPKIKMRDLTAEEKSTQEFMNRWREDHSRNSSEPMYTGD